jgi:hypothetical protein
MITGAIKGTSTILTSNVVRLLGPRELVFKQEQIDVAAIGPDGVIVATEFSVSGPAGAAAGSDLSALSGLL